MAPAAAPAASDSRVVVPFRLASESMRNWPDTTTFWPGSMPLRISVMPFASVPISTSTGRNLPSPSATNTTARLPVTITASDGTTVISGAPAGTNSTDA